MSVQAKFVQSPHVFNIQADLHFLNTQNPSKCSKTAPLQPSTVSQSSYVLLGFYLSFVVAVGAKEKIDALLLPPMASSLIHVPKQLSICMSYTAAYLTVSVTVYSEIAHLCFCLLRLFKIILHQASLTFFSILQNAVDDIVDLISLQIRDLIK